MAYAEKEVFINRPVSVVYDFLADGLNNLRWRPGIVELNLVAGKPDTAGATYRQVMRAPFGRRIAADYRLTKAERDAELAFEVISGPVQPTGRAYFTISGAGTKLRLVLEYHPKGLHILKEPLAQWIVRREVQYLEELKYVLERP